MSTKPKSQPRKARRKGYNGAGKGPAHERKTCQRLSLWVSNCTREDCFWRSAMSGGRARLMSKRVTEITPGRKMLLTKETRKRAFNAAAGDIAATHHLGGLLLDLFLIECKYYADLKLEALIYGNEGLVTGWWRDLQQQGITYKRAPMLVLRQNNREELVGVCKAGAAILAAGGLIPAHATFPQLGLRLYSFADMIHEIDFNKLREKYGK